MTFEAKDLLGNPIEVGSIITYPGRQGGDMWINHAVVRDIEVVEAYSGPKAKLKVITVAYESWNASVSAKKSTITAVERVTVLPRSLFDDSVNWQKRLLEVRNEVLGKGSPLPKSSDFDDLPIG